MSDGPPPYYAPGYPWYPPPPGLPGHHPPHHGHHPPHHGHHPPHHGHPPPEHYPHYPIPPMPYYIPGAVMMPVPIPAPIENPTQQPTYITNYIYQGDPNATPAASTEIVKVAETSGDFDWVPTTSTLAGHLTGRAVVGGHEGWDGSPLWIIRAWHKGDLVPGKLSVRHNSASIPYDGREVPVQNIEVLCSKENSLRWVPGANGNVPPSAVLGGQTATGEKLYIGRAKYQMSLTPGKIHQSHKTCYISFTGTEVAINMYDVLCRLS